MQGGESSASQPVMRGVDRSLKESNREGGDPI
jgi:hypothetical protein